MSPEQQAYEAWRADTDPTPGPIERLCHGAFRAGFECRIDAEVDRVMGLSDEELTTEMIAAGLDPEVEAMRSKTIVRLTMEMVRLRTAIKPFAKAAEHVPEDQQDYKVVAYVPAGQHADKFKRMSENLTAGNFRSAKKAYDVMEEKA